MRTTIRLDDRLLADAKRAAHDSGKTLTALIEDALREVLARRRLGPKKTRIRLPAFKGDGLRPGVHLDDNAALFDVMGDDPGSL